MIIDNSERVGYNATKVDYAGFGAFGPFQTISANPLSVASAGVLDPFIAVGLSFNAHFPSGNLVSIGTI